MKTKVSVFQESEALLEDIINHEVTEQELEQFAKQFADRALPDNPIIVIKQEEDKSEVIYQFIKEPPMPGIPAFAKAYERLEPIFYRGWYIELSESVRGIQANILDLPCEVRQPINDLLAMRRFDNREDVKEVAAAILDRIPPRPIKVEIIGFAPKGEQRANRERDIALKVFSNESSNGHWTGNGHSKNGKDDAKL